MKNIRVKLVPLAADGREQFILDNQWSFKHSALLEFGERDNHIDADGEIISRKTVEMCMDAENSETYRIVLDGKNVGGMILQINKETNENESIEALKGLDITIDSGEFVAVLGHNGSGKSTFAKLINGLYSPKDGVLIVNGYDTKVQENIWNIRQNVGMVFQNPDNQMVAALVEDEVAFAPENLGVEPKEIRRRVDECLEIVNMTKYAQSSPSKLSGGQKQRVAIASVLAMNPEILILDEPTAMLDPKGRSEVIKTIKMLNEEKDITVVLITHYMDEAAQADRTVVIDDGEIVLDGTPKEVFKNVEKLKSLGLDVPQVTELAYELRKMGIEISDDVLTVDECFDEIIRILGETKR